LVLPTKYDWYVGIDWGAEKHRACCLAAAGELLEWRWVEHSGDGLAGLVDWLMGMSEHQPAHLAIGIEVPRGAIVETLVERGFAVFSINPKQLDRFRDRYSPAGAKDDNRDAMVLADALRTDSHCFRQVRLDDPCIIRLREISRLEEDLSQDFYRLANQVREQLWRYFPQLLQLAASPEEPWIWELLEMAPLPQKAAKLSLSKITRVLKKHRIRRFDAGQVHDILAAAPVFVVPGTAEAASEHILILLPRLRMLHQQISEIAQRMERLLEEMGAAGTDCQPGEHRDATILLSLPGVGRKVSATVLSEASQALADRDYHGLRCLAGTAPITRQSGKQKVVLMRYACNQRLRNALHYWASGSIQHDPRSKQMYQDMRARGLHHNRALRGIADRLLEMMISMLLHRSMYDPQRRVA
jgi:transposase